MTCVPKTSLQTAIYPEPLISAAWVLVAPQEDGFRAVGCKFIREFTGSYANIENACMDEADIEGANHFGVVVDNAGGVRCRIRRCPPWHASSFAPAELSDDASVPSEESEDLYVRSSFAAAPTLVPEESSWTTLGRGCCAAHSPLLRTVRLLGGLVGCALRCEREEGCTSISWGWNCDTGVCDDVCVMYGACFHPLQRSDGACLGGSSSGATGVRSYTLR
jgi:hypothetical protein